IDPSAQPQPPVDPTAGEKAYAAVPGETQSNLYVSSTAELDEASVGYCADTKDACAADAAKWHPMQRYAGRQDKQIFVSPDQLGLDVSKKELPIQLRG